MKADSEEKDNNSYIAMYYDVSEEHWVYIQLTIGGSTVVSYFFWVDERTKVAVAIGSNLDYSVTLHICESLKLCNSTK